MDRRAVGILLVAVGAVGLLTFPLYTTLFWNNSSSQYGTATSWNSGLTGQQLSAGTGISFDEAVAQFQSYIAATGNKDLALREVMEFENNYYAIVYEKSTGVGAFELLIDKTGGNRHGMMGGMMGRGGQFGQMGMMNQQQQNAHR